MVSVAVQSVQDVKNIVKDSNKNDGNGLVHDNGYDPYKVFVSVLFVVLQCKNVSSLLLYLYHCMIFCASVTLHLHFEKTAGPQRCVIEKDFAKRPLSFYF